LGDFRGDLTPPIALAVIAVELTADGKRQLRHASTDENGRYNVTSLNRLIACLFAPRGLAMPITMPGWAV
jgi:hypothetical protein